MQSVSYQSRRTSTEIIFPHNYARSTSDNIVSPPDYVECARNIEMSNESSTTGTSAQDDTPTLLAFPLEVRKRIYRKVLGQHHFPLGTDGKNVFYVPKTIAHQNNCWIWMHAVAAQILRRKSPNLFHYPSHVVRSMTSCWNSRQPKLSTGSKSFHTRLRHSAFLSRRHI